MISILEYCDQIQVGDIVRQGSWDSYFRIWKIENDLVYLDKQYTQYYKKWIEKNYGVRSHGFRLDTFTKCSNTIRAQIESDIINA